MWSTSLKQRNPGWVCTVVVGPCFLSSDKHMEPCPLTERSTTVDCIPMHGGGCIYIYACANSPRIFTQHTSVRLRFENSRYLNGVLWETQNLPHSNDLFVQCQTFCWSNLKSKCKVKVPIAAGDCDFEWDEAPCILVLFYAPVMLALELYGLSAHLFSFVSE